MSDTNNKTETKEEEEKAVKRMLFGIVAILLLIFSILAYFDISTNKTHKRDDFKNANIVIKETLPERLSYQLYEKLYNNRQKISESSKEYEQRNKTLVYKIPLASRIDDYNLELNYSTYNKDTKKLNLNFGPYKKANTHLSILIDEFRGANSYTVKTYLTHRNIDLTSDGTLSVYLKNAVALKPTHPIYARHEVSLTNVMELKDWYWQFEYKPQISSESIKPAELFLPYDEFISRTPVYIPIKLTRIKLMSGDKDIFTFNISDSDYRIKY